MKEFVVIYFIDKKTNENYLLRKNKPQMYWLHDKLVGFGGKVEIEDKDFFETAIREVKEELNLEIKRENLIYRGYMINSFDHKVYQMIYFLDERLEEGEIDGEGEAKYYPYNFYLTNSEEFPEVNREVNKILFSSNKFIQIDNRKP